MGVETRYKKGKLYYYRKRREGERVISEYVVSGPAQIATHLSAREQKERQIRKRAAFAQIDAQIDLLIREVDRLVREWLLSQGFHQHKRQWRLKRMSKAANLDRDLAVAIVTADYKGDEQSKAECLRLAEQHKETLQSGSLTAELTEKMLIDMLASGKGGAIVLREEVEGMRRRMGYEESSEIERLLIDRIVMCWLRMLKAEQEFASEHKAGSAQLTQLEYTERQALRAQTMYLKSIDALSRFKLLRVRIEEIKSRIPPPEPKKGAMLKAV